MSSLTAIKSNSYAPRKTHRVRAKYYPQEDGSLRLAMIQAFNLPKFREPDEVPDHPIYQLDYRDFMTLDEASELVEKPVERIVQGNPDDIERAARRAKIAAFDKIQCNHDMVLFSTLTYAPDSVSERDEYEQVYEILRPWLSNMVQRHGLKYVLTPERHKKGGIHLHMISNAPKSLQLAKALSAKTGRPLTHNGHALLNVNSWKYGFSSAEFIGDERTDRDKVSKYIFKYIGKQAGQKIGGRYLLSGGKFDLPLYAYGESIDEFHDGIQAARFDREVDVGLGITYKEISYV